MKDQSLLGLSSRGSLKDQIITMVSKIITMARPDRVAVRRRRSGSGRNPEDMRLARIRQNNKGRGSPELLVTRLVPPFGFFLFSPEQVIDVNRGKKQDRP